MHDVHTQDITRFLADLLIINNTIYKLIFIKNNI